jgi:hypothetical protein
MKKATPYGKKRRMLFATSMRSHTFFDGNGLQSIMEIRIDVNSGSTRKLNGRSVTNRMMDTIAISTIDLHALDIWGIL